MLLDEYNIPLYEKIADLNRKHGVFLVKNIESGKIYVEKLLTVYNREVYDYLLNNPIKGTPQVIELYEKGEVLILIEEYITGTTLSELLENGRRFSERETISIIKQLCEILEKLHKASPPIINRDIKPSNIILNDDGFVKLVDMNSSKWENPDESQDTMLIGTEGYAAPEQYGFGSSDRRTDIYSLGVLMNRLLTGELPGVCSAQGRLSAVIKKCTHMDPRDRYQSVEELSEALKEKKKLPGLFIFFILAVIVLCVIIESVFLKRPEQPENVTHLSELPAGTLCLCKDNELICRDGGKFFLSEAGIYYVVLDGETLTDYKWNRFGEGRVEQQEDGGLIFAPGEIGPAYLVVSYEGKNGYFRWECAKPKEEHRGLELYLPGDGSVICPETAFDPGVGDCTAYVLYNGERVVDFEAAYSGAGFIVVSPSGIIDLCASDVGIMELRVRYNGEEAIFLWQASDKIRELADGYEAYSLLLNDETNELTYSSGETFESMGTIICELLHKNIKLENFEIIVHGNSGTVNVDDHGTFYLAALQNGSCIIEIRYGEKVSYFNWETKV